MTRQGPLTDAEIIQLEGEIYPPRSLFVIAYSFVALSSFLVGLAVGLKLGGVI